MAVLISLLVLLHELDHPRVVASGPAPGLVVVRPEERLFFANARRVVDHIAAVAGNRQPPPRVVLVDLSAVNDLEITALERLADHAEELHVVVTFALTALSALVSRVRQPDLARP